MTVQRITATLNSRSVSEMRHFYDALFGLSLAMDLAWTATLTPRA